MATRNSLARALGLDPVEVDFTVSGVSPLSAPRPNTLTFSKGWSASLLTLIDGAPTTAFLVNADGVPPSCPANALPVRSPRLAYAELVRDQIAVAPPPAIASTAVISHDAVLGSRISVGHFCVIESGVWIGDDTRVDSHAVLKSGVTLGSRCRIGTHTAIGGSGFGYEVNDAGTPVHIAHLGGVVIGDDVEIGSHVTIAQGTIEPTRIGNDVKIDDAVFIAHNVQVGRSSFIIAGAEISGSVTLGERTWISPEASLINQVTVGDDALVGIGAVVVRDVAPNTIVAGVPAKERGFRYPDRARPKAD